MDPICASSSFPHPSCRLDDSEDWTPPEPSEETSAPTKGDPAVHVQSRGTSGCPFIINPDSYDFDAHIQSKIISPELFGQYSTSDADAISPRDVVQGSLRDCHLLSALAALANTPQGRALIRSAVVENRNAGGQVVSYSVTLHARRPSTLGSVLGPVRYLNRNLGEQVDDAYRTLSKVVVTVDNTYACGHTGAPESPSGAHEVWPLVFEKAIAQVGGGYRSLSQGGFAHRAMEMLTGVPASAHELCAGTSLRRFLPGNYVAGDVSAAVAAGKLVVLNAKPSFKSADQPLPDGIVAEHAYAVSSIVTVEGKPSAVLINPWGFANPDPIPLETLSRYFGTVSVGSIH